MVRPQAKTAHPSSWRNPHRQPRLVRKPIVLAAARWNSPRNLMAFKLLVVSDDSNTGEAKVLLRAECWYGGLEERGIRMRNDVTLAGECCDTGSAGDVRVWHGGYM